MDSKQKVGVNPWSQPKNKEAADIGWRDRSTRQQRRRDARIAAWKRWRCQVSPTGGVGAGPRDDKGVMSRRTRRSIAMTIARKAQKMMSHAGGSVAKVQNQ